MKRVFALLLCLILVFCMTGCSTSVTEESKEPAQQDQEAVEELAAKGSEQELVAEKAVEEEPVEGKSGTLELAGQEEPAVEEQLVVEQSISVISNCTFDEFIDRFNSYGDGLMEEYVVLDKDKFIVSENEGGELSYYYIYEEALAFSLTEKDDCIIILYYFCPELVDLDTLLYDSAFAFACQYGLTGHTYLKGNGKFQEQDQWNVYYREENGYYNEYSIMWLP